MPVVSIPTQPATQVAELYDSVDKIEDLIKQFIAQKGGSNLNLPGAWGKFVGKQPNSKLVLKMKTSIM